MGDRIIIAEKAMVEDSEGNVWSCTFWVPKRSYCADLFVDHSRVELELWDDRVFTANVYRFLKALGYKGPEIHRAELGMQAYDSTAYEIFNPTWEEFVTKLGWVDLDKEVE